MNCWKCIALGVACILAIVRYPCYANNQIVEDSSRSEVPNKKIQFQASIGIASTNFSYPSPGYGNKYLYLIRSDLFLIKKVSLRSDIRAGIAYEPIGFRSNIYLINGLSSFTRHRLFYGNLHLLYSYRLSKQTNRFENRLITGIFLGKLINNDILSFVKPDNILYRSKAGSTFGPWNTGLSLGVSSSILITQKKTLGLKVIYHLGTANIYIQEATDRTGFKRYTRSIALSTFLNF